MKINNNDINMNKIMKAYQNMNQNKNKQVEQKKRTSDQVNISKEAKDIKKMQKSLQEKPDIRRKKVEEIKKQVSNGTYKVNPEKIAEKIVSDLEE
ncbi:MAG TPA: flagellar biosynthesis anti-sigma factor FlgM [Halanaerobiales bacterium]|nr:flagellar biosynthesis anti-sigma factor FlgM [Halanaerobiales bacterium]